MTTDDTLARALSDLRSGIPDADTEFAALTTRLDAVDRRRGGRRTATYGVAVAGVAAVVATGAHYLPDGHGAPSRSAAAAPTAGSAASASGGRDAASSPALRQVAYSTRLATSTGDDGIRRPVITVGVGWLPEHATLATVGAGGDNGVGGEKRWTVPYADGYGSYTTGVQVIHEDGLPEHCFLCTAAHELTVQGHPAREFTGDDSFAENQVEIFVDLGDGRVAEVLTFFETHGLSRADAEAVTEHVAREMTFDGHETVPVTAVLTAAPAGDTIVSADAGFGEYSGTVYELNAVHGGAEIGIGGLAEKYPVTTGRAGRDVQGRPSVIIHQDGRLGLYIKGLYGPYTKLYVGAGAEHLDDLYRIADGIRPVK